MKDPDEVSIAPGKTVADWKTRRAALMGNDDPVLWGKTYDEFFLGRLKSRYLDPIDTLQAHDVSQGEGFTMVTVQCALIEFLAATVKGENYRHVKDKELKQHEYNKSGAMFAAFLHSEAPFAAHFVALSLAEEFYRDVRCALLHEARTRNRWTIWGKHDSGAPIDPVSRVVYRDNLQLTLGTYMADYRERLIASKALREAFIRKFNNLCD